MIKDLVYNSFYLECSGTEESKPKEYDIDIGKELHFGCSSGCLKILKVLLDVQYLENYLLVCLGFVCL